MKPGIPWSVKGIGDDAREAAKQAARRSGMTLGEWLNTVILDQAPQQQVEERVSYRPPPPRRPAPYPRDDFNNKLDDIAAQLARLAAREQETAHFQEPASEPEADREIVNEILARLDNNDRKTAEAFQAVQAHLSTLDQQLSQTPLPSFPENPEDVPGYQALESALRNIVDHIETSEKRSRETLKTIHDRMAEVAQTAASAESERILQSAPSIARLEDRLSDVISRLERTEAATQHALPSLVDHEVTKLSERLDAVPDLIAAETGRLSERMEAVPELIASETGRLSDRIEALSQASAQLAQNTGRLSDRIETVTQASAQLTQNTSRLADRIEAVSQAAEQMAENAQANALQAAQTELREIESRIQGALKDTQGAMRAANPTGEIQRVRSDLDRLNQRIDDLKADAASERDLHSLKVAMEQLSARVAQGPDLRPLTDMDRRLAEITRRIEQSQGQTKLEPQIAALERRVYDLDRKLAEAMLNQQDTRAVGALERQISAVSDRLGQTEQQLGHLAALEHSVNQLFQSLEQNRNSAREIAEDAANRMADRLLKAYPQITEAQPPTPGPSPELVALEQGLEAVRASASVADQRNQETLHAVHDTLEQIVNKIAELESTTLASPPASAWQEPVPTPRQEAYESAHEVAPDPFAYVPSPIPEPMVPTSPPEPEQAIEPRLTAAPPSQEPGEPSPEAEPPPQPPQGYAGEDFKQDDFIAAARRAAQAAARQPPGPIASGMGFFSRAKTKATKASKGTSRFSLPFLSHGKREPEPEEKPANGSNDGKRRRLILAGLVLLAAVSAYAFNTLGRAPHGSGPNAQNTLAPVPQDKGPAAQAAPVVQVEPVAQAEPRSAKSDSLVRDEILTASLQAPASQGDRAADAPPPQEMIAATIGPESLRTAALNGDAQAQFIVASRYLDGKSVDQDYAAASRWYQKAAAKGLAPAQYRIGTLFERGKGVPQDMVLARVWYERAAERGNVKAMHNVAVIYAGQQAGEPDYEKAARWFTEAGEHGLKDSQYNLAVLYERGLGVKQDASQALYWYSLAAKQNDGDAALRAGTLERMLAPSTVSQVRERIQAFAAKEDNVGANIVAVNDPSWQNDVPPSTAQALPYDMPVLGAAIDLSAQPLDSISETQTLLNKLGYDIGTPDGRMGTRTANAIRLFQLQSGMKVTGEVTDDLLVKLRAKKG